MINYASIPTELRAKVELHQQRICETADSAELAVIEHRAELQQVWAASDFIANFCSREPATVCAMIAAGRLDQPTPVADIKTEIETQVAACADEIQLDRCIRRLRQREMMAIAWRDLSGVSTLEQTMSAVSWLAECSISAVLEKHQQWLCQRHGQPLESDSGEVATMVVLGLGKLGGKELNFSSDVDLVFAYSGGGSSSGGNGNDGKALDNQAFFARLGQKLIKTLNTRTADGFVFRTDMRLRPNGDSGPIVLSFAAIEDYYQTHGRSWERYALIKARVVGGNRQAGRRLLDSLQPFIYRKYLDFGAFESIRSMKSLIESEIQRKGAKRDIKLGRGGIREVEFWTQSHQLIRGGREQSLRTPQLYVALDAIVALGILDDPEQKILRDAYRFLRNTEHRLQMVNDEQTQTLPTEPLKRLRLAWSMDFPDWSAFELTLKQHLETVHQQFVTLLKAETAHQADPHLHSLSEVWLDVVDIEAAHQRLSVVGYTETEAVIALLEQFRRGKLLQAYSSIERDRLDKLMPLALQEAGKLSNAKRALTQFVSVIESIGRRSTYLMLLIENPVALRQLLRLCAASAWISRWIGRYPVVLDGLLQPISSLSGLDSGFFNAELNRRMAQCEAGDLGHEMNQLREFHHAQVLQIAAADVIGVIDSEHVNAALTTLAEVILQAVFELAQQHVNKRFTARQCDAGIIAYGKLGGLELGYHSDLDIVLCYDDSLYQNSDNEHFFMRLGQRLVHLLTTRTAAGLLYEIDLRLRPSGRRGTLVTSLEGFAKYQLKQAWTWEHQALVRARVVVGNHNFRKEFERIRSDILRQKREPKQLQQDVVEMRAKMIAANCRSDQQWYDIKLDHGGLVDIEFMVQYLVLRHAVDKPELIQPRSISGCLQSLAQAMVISADLAQQLSQSYQLYLQKSLELKLNDQPVLIQQDQLQQPRSQVSDAWDLIFRS